MSRVESLRAGEWSVLRGVELRALRGLAAGLALMSGLCVAPTHLARADESESSKSTSAPRVVIHFADLNGIDDWRVASDGSLLIEGRNKRWYRATFFGACSGLRFASAIGFVTESTGDLDRFSSILVDGERCYFRTLERIEPPEGSATEERAEESSKD